MTRAYKILKSSILCIAGSTLMATSATAQSYQVDVRTCPTTKGALTINPSSIEAWDAMKSNTPDTFVQSMIIQSNCFAVNGASGMRYSMRFGPLTPQEFAAGPSSFTGRSVLEPVTSIAGGIPQAGGGIPQSGGGIPQSGSSNNAGFGLGSADNALTQADRALGAANSAEYYAKRGTNLGNIDSIGDARYSMRSVGGAVNSLGSLGNMFGGGNKAPKDRYAYVEILNSSGQVLARGFGQNNRADLDFTHWTNGSAIKKFGSNKKSRRMGGALYNAYNDAQNHIMSPSFGVPVR